MIDTAYIDQRKEKNWPAGSAAGQTWVGIPPWSQCFYSSVVMFLTFFLGKDNSEGLFTKYFADVETETDLVDGGGIGQAIMQKNGLPVVINGVRQRSGQFWAVHCDAANIYLRAAGKSFRALWGEITWAAVDQILQSGTTPIVLGTRFPPSDGHIVLLVGISDDGKNYIVRDPYGYALDGYKDYYASGDCVQYPKEWVQKWASIDPVSHGFAPVGNARVMYAAG